MKTLNELKKYVPRHMRLGTIVKDVCLAAKQDILESVPVVLEDGSVHSTHRVLKSVDAFENMSKYSVSRFRLSALLDSGVPLKVVNINSSNVASIEQLNTICQSLDDADKFVQRLEAERKEKQSWFNPSENDLQSQN